MKPSEKGVLRNVQNIKYIIKNAKYVKTFFQSWFVCPFNQEWILTR